MHFLALPFEIKANVFALACVDPRTPPAALSALSRTCREFHAFIHDPRCDVLSLVCHAQYDLAAPIRRLGGLTNAVCARELERRCRALARIAALVVYGETVVHDLWVAYLMLLEDDGRNLVRLEHVRVEQWARQIIILRAREVLDVHGWPQETELLQLAAAILARVSTRASVAQQTEQQRDELFAQILPFFMAGHRYPTALLPTTYHYLCTTRRLPPTHTHTFHTMAAAPVYPAAALPFAPFGRRIALSRPPLAHSCILVWYLLVQRLALGHLPHTPATRALAEAAGYHAATVEDYAEANRLQREGRGIEVPRAGGSRRWDQEWYRLALAHCVLSPDPVIDRRLSACWYRTVYEPGQMSGNWMGRALTASFPWYSGMLQMHPAPLERVAETLAEHQMFHSVIPMQLRMREHFSCQPAQLGVVGRGEVADGVQNGWFPDQLDISRPRGGMRLTADELVIQDPLEPDARYATKRYKTWAPGVEFPEAAAPPEFPLTEAAQPSPPPDLFVDDAIPEDVDMTFSQEFDSSGEEDDAYMYPDEDVPFVDIILTGKTDYNQGEAWGHYDMYGRVRRHDGLFVIVRAPRDRKHGRWIFRGYMYGDHALVGRWRETGTSHDVAGWEGPFVLARMPDSWPRVSS